MSSYSAKVRVWRVISVAFHVGFLLLCRHEVACRCGPVCRSIVICREGRQPASKHWGVRVTMAPPSLRWRCDVASARSTHNTPCGAHASTFPAPDRLPKGGGEFSPNLPAPVRVAVTCNVVLLRAGACLEYHPWCLPFGSPAFVQTLDCLPLRPRPPQHCDLP